MAASMLGIRDVQRKQIQRKSNRMYSYIVDYEVPTNFYKFNYLFFMDLNFGKIGLYLVVTISEV